MKKFILSLGLILAMSSFSQAQSASFDLNVTFANPTTGGTVTSIEIQESKDGTTWTAVTTLPATATSGSKTSIPAGFVYQYRLVAKGPFGQAIAPVAPYVVAAIAPDPRSNVQFTIIPRP